MPLKFVPPKSDETFPRYASYAGGEMKTHRGMGGAKSSFNNRGWTWAPNPENPDKRIHVTKHGFILESVQGEWFVRYEIKPGLVHRELPWIEKIYKHKTYGWVYTDLASYQKADDFYVEYRNHRVTTDEYVDWRLAVEMERNGLILPLA